MTEDIIVNFSEISEESIPANELLEQVLEGATTSLRVRNIQNTATTDLETVATKLPISHSSFSHLERPAPIERQCSDITMSDFGDSTHHPTSVGGTRRSLRNPSRWIQEGKVEESSDDDDDDDDDRALYTTRYVRKGSLAADYQSEDEFRLDPSRPIASRRLHKATINHTSKNSRAKRLQLKESSSVLSSYHDSPTERDSWQWPHHSWSSLPAGMNPSDGDIRVTYAMGYSSCSSYFTVNTAPQNPHSAFFIQDQPSHTAPPRRMPGTVAPTSNYKAHQSRSQRMDDYIESLLEDDVEDDNTTDDVSVAASFFDEDPRGDKDHHILHRSDGSLDFRSTLKKKSTTFRDRKGNIPTSCFHLSLSTSSRWDGGLPDPTTVSLLPRHDQAAVAKAAISTYLPVRPPPRKLTPTRYIHTPSTGSTSDSNHNNHNSLSTVFTSTESTEPSPQMPLRKASTHGSAHLSVNAKDEFVSNLSLLDPPTGRSGRPSTIVTESSPQLPIRKASSYHSEHSTQPDSNAMLSAGGASPPTTVDTPSMRRMRAFISTSGPILEDGPIRQPERKSSSLVVVFDEDDDHDLPLKSQDGVSMSTTWDSPLTVMDDHPIRLPVRKLSALTLSSSTHHSSQTPPRPPKPSQQDVLSSINDKQ